MKIMQQISKMVDKLLTMIQNFFFGPQGVLDQIIPMALIKDIISAVGEIGAIAGNLGQMAGGFTAVTNITTQLNSFTSQGMSALNDPMSLITNYFPQAGSAISAIKGAASGNMSGITQALGNISGAGGKLNQAMSALRDPMGMLSQFVPPQIMSQMQNLSKIPGLGSVGNLGYGLGDIMDSLKKGVISDTLSQFSAQAGILAPLLNVQGPPPIASPSADQQVAIQGAAVNPSVPVAHGVPIQTTPAPPIFAQA
jgi:hypothetical protein